ncbi:MAG: hypothetical protein AAB519_03830, partial [Patescibacteria group bacterium]
IFKLGIPGYYGTIMDSRAADDEKETLQKEFSAPVALAAEGDIKEGVRQLQDGTFYVPGLRSDTKSFKKQEDAIRAIQKEQFEDSDKNFLDLGEYVLRKREDGTSYPQRKDVFTTSLLTAKMTGAKKNDDFEEWTTLADQQYQLLQRLVEDPTVDELERAEFQNKMMTLEDDMEKFLEYGGAFKKGKGAKKLEEKFRYDLVDPDLISLETGLAGVGDRGNLVSPIPMRVRKPKLVKTRKVRRKRINL